MLTAGLNRKEGSMKKGAFHRDGKRLFTISVMAYA